MNEIKAQNDEEIKRLKDKLYRRFGIVLTEDDPAWLMILIYNDLLKEVNKSIDDLNRLPQVTQKNESILSALTDLQTRLNDLYDTAEKIINYAVSSNEEFENSVRNDIAKIDKQVKDSIDKAIDTIDIDTSKIEKAISEKLRKIDLSTVRETVDKANRAANTIDNSIGKLDESSDRLNDKTEEIDRAIKSMNKANRSISRATIAAALFAGVVLGFLVATYFKIDAVSDYYFSGYEKKIAAAEKQNENLKKEMQKATALTKFLMGRNIDWGNFTDAPAQFIALSTDELVGPGGKTVYSSHKKPDDYSFIRNNVLYIRLKPLHH